MDKYNFINAQVMEMLADAEEFRFAKELHSNHDEQLFWNYANSEPVIDKDFAAEMESETEIDFPIYWEPYVLYGMEAQDLDRLLHEAKHGSKAICRRHRAANRKEKVKKRQNSRWQYYIEGTAKECKSHNHKAVRREYDLPSGKSNFSHKVGSYLYFW